LPKDVQRAHGNSNLSQLPLEMLWDEPWDEPENHPKLSQTDLGVSINGGIPKWLVYNGKSWKIQSKWMI
jgi:hypothetical protein